MSSSWKSKSYLKLSFSTIVRYNYIFRTKTPAEFANSEAAVVRRENRKTAYNNHLKYYPKKLQSTCIYILLNGVTTEKRGWGTSRQPSLFSLFGKMKLQSVKQWDKFWFMTVISNPFFTTTNEWLQYKVCKCKCRCWEKRIVSVGSLIYWIIKSCWCRERGPNLKWKDANKHKTHGKSNSRVYKIWSWMKHRCFNKKSQFYYCYWGRWVTVCSEWMNFEWFYKDMGDPPSDKHSIERVDVNWNYCKKNCIWIEVSKQSRNTRNNVFYKWKPYTVFCEELGISKSTVSSRLKKWRSMEDAIYTRPRYIGKRSRLPKHS